MRWYSFTALTKTMRQIYHLTKGLNRQLRFKPQQSVYSKQSLHITPSGKNCNIHTRNVIKGIKSNFDVDLIYPPTDLCHESII